MESIEIKARAETVGSLLRPPALLKARTTFAGGHLPIAELKAIEDQAVDEALALQEEVGLKVVTDGEMRRLSFQSQMTEAVEGFGNVSLDTFTWGDWHNDDAIGHQQNERPTNIGITGKLRRQRSLSTEEFVYLRDRTDRIVKVTLPSPSLFVNFWSPAHPPDAYRSLDAFLADVVAILREEICELIQLGARYIQIDAPHYPLLLDPATRAFYESRGWTMTEWLDRGIELDNSVMSDFSDITFGMHLCRGNQGGRWLVEGGYEPIAEAIFKKVSATRLLLEYDDVRSGSFEPLRHISENKTIVLGLISTKRPEIESVEELLQRIEEAQRYVPLERLALSPQCGFSTSILGSPLSFADQKCKLELVSEVARRVWD
jgi:5-methyltetrahydropteroyltriglutamate--homocysteine methyltransferase